MPAEVGLTDGTKLHVELDAEEVRDLIWKNVSDDDAGWLRLGGEGPYFARRHVTYVLDTAANDDVLIERID
jgi:hypothetical protein